MAVKAIETISQPNSGLSSEEQGRWIWCVLIPLFFQPVLAIFTYLMVVNVFIKEFSPIIRLETTPTTTAIKGYSERLLSIILFVFRCVVDFVFDL